MKDIEKNSADITCDPRWETLLTRDPDADGKFVYSVRTTGIYCRPTCASRLADPKNITFHNCPAEAERAGFRPCRRCRPDERSRAEMHAEIVADICRFIESADHIPTLDELSSRSGWSPYYLHRIFRSITGLTPRAYAAARRAEQMRSELGRSGSITRAIYNAGYNSSSRFYEESDHVIGMKPGSYRDGGKDEVIRFAVGRCSLGDILVARSDRGVCAILMGEDPDELVRDLQERFPAAELVGGDVEFETLVAKVVGFIESPWTKSDLPLDIRGTAFQRRVWKVLSTIPAGKTISYTELANLAGNPNAARAVAQACGANSLAVAIPCHRVVRKDGGVSGYRWGVERKRALLQIESRRLQSHKV